MISSIIGFIKTLKKFHKDKNYEYFYRGHADFEYKLLPSIYRDNFIKNENNIYREIIIRTPNEFINHKAAIEQLVKMQHYGLPTRLLDITTNPLVALYFACGISKNDGEVLILKVPKNDVKFFDSDTVTILSNVAKRPIDFDISNTTKSDIDKFNKESPIPYLLHEIRDEKPQFLPIIDPDDFNRVIPVKVKMDNERIIKQNGLFLLFGINDKKEIPAKIPDDWVLNNTFKHYDFKISNNQKDKILKDLDIMGINESTMFPELPKQTEYVKNYFK